jgi:HSP20 family protein
MNKDKKNPLRKIWGNEEKEDLEMPGYEGQLALDVYQTDTDVIVKAPIAGVKPEDLEVSITDEIVTIKGQRKEETKIEKENYFAQECYWGAFSRTFALPVAVDADKATAVLKDGILTLTIPKAEKAKTKIVKIKSAA